MRKYYNETIEITLHTNKESLVAMIETILGNRKSLDKFDGLGVKKRKFRWAFPKKKNFFSSLER